MATGNQGIDTALARLLHETGQVELAVLQASLEEVRRRRAQEPSVTLAGVLQARGQAPVAVLEDAVARLASLDEDYLLANSLGTADPEPLRAGTVKQYGPYRVVRELARGGMGAVLLVVDERSGVRYALKTLLGLSHAADARRRFELEVEALGRLDHPHIVRVHTAELEGHPPYLVQELLTGGTLADRVRERPLDPATVVALGQKLCAALARCHAAGVLHRDLKPGNVMFDERGEPKLVDFGLVRALADDRSRLTETGELLGTPGYLAPEQARADRLTDARTDVYGLGATLFALLTRQPPFPGRGLAGLAAVVHDPPPAPSALNPDVPPALEAVILQALAKDPAARFDDAAAFGEALGATLDAPTQRASGGWLVAAGLAVGVLGLTGWLATRHTVPPPTPGEPVASTAPAPSPAPAEATPGRDPQREAWRRALETARRELRRQGVEHTMAALAAFGWLDGTAPDLPERDALRVAVQDAVTRFLPDDGVLDARHTPELATLLRIATYLPARPPLEAKLWEQTWRAATASRIHKGQGFGPLDDDMQALLSDLDPTNMELQQTVLRNSDVMGGKNHMLNAARRWADHPHDDPRTALVAQVRLLMILAQTAVWAPESRAEVLRRAAAILKRVEQARGDGRTWPASRKFPLPYSPPLDWLAVCEGQTRLARSRSLLGESRAEDALADLDRAQQVISQAELPALRALCYERMEQPKRAIQIAVTNINAHGAENFPGYETRVGILWRIHRKHPKLLPHTQLRPILRRFLANAKTNGVRWVCLAWLDHLAGEPELRDRHIAKAQRLLKNPAMLRWFPGVDRHIADVRRALRTQAPEALQRLEQLAHRCGEAWW